MAPAGDRHARCSRRWVSSRGRQRTVKPNSIFWHLCVRATRSASTRCANPAHDFDALSACCANGALTACSAGGPASDSRCPIASRIFMLQRCQRAEIRSPPALSCAMDSRPHEAHGAEPLGRVVCGAIVNRPKVATLWLGHAIVKNLVEPPQLLRMRACSIHPTQDGYCTVTQNGLSRIDQPVSRGRLPTSHASAAWKSGCTRA